MVAAPKKRAVRTRIGRGKKYVVPGRKRPVQDNGYQLNVWLLCECGEERAVNLGVSRGGRDTRGIAAACCLRRYVLTGWGKDGPLLKCIGVEDWGHPDRQPGFMVIVPIVGETDDEEGLRLLAEENARVLRGDGWLRRPGTSAAIVAQATGTERV